MPLPSAFVTPPTSVCFQNLAETCHRAPSGSGFGSWVLAETMAVACICNMAILRPAMLLFDHASPSHPLQKRRLVTQSQFLQGTGGAACCIAARASYALAFRTPVSPLGLYSPSPQGRGVHNSREPQIIRLVTTLNRCLGTIFLVTNDSYGRSVHFGWV